MKLVLIRGREGSGKSRALMARIKNTMSAGKPVYVLVPQQFTFQAERDLMARLDVKGLMGIEVLSFERLAHRVLQETGHHSEVFLDDTGRLMALRSVINACREELEAFKAAAGSPGFLQKAGETVRELNQYAFTPGEAAKQAASCADRLLAAKLRDCARIAGDFDAFLAGRYIDPEGRLRTMCGEIEKCVSLRGASFFIDGLDSLTPLMAQVVESILRIAGEMTVTLSVDPRKDRRNGGIFSVGEYYEGILRDMAMRTGATVEWVDTAIDEAHRAAGKREALSFAEKELFSFPRRAYPDDPGDAIRLFCGSSPQAEVDYTVTRMVALAREKGFRWREMAIVCTDLPAYAPALQRTLRRAGVPFFLDLKHTAREMAAAEVLVQALRASDGRRDRTAILRLAKTGYAGIDEAACDALENYARFADLRGRRWLKKAETGEELFDLEAVERARETLMAPLEELTQGLHGKKTVREMCTVLLAYLERIGLRAQLQTEYDAWFSLGQQEKAQQLSQVWELILSVLDQAVLLLGNERIPVSELAQVIESALDGADIGVIPSALDQVLIGTLQRSRSPEIKALFLLGANDENGMDAVVQEGLLHRSDADLLAAQGAVMARTSALRFSQVRFEQYQMIARPVDSLTVTYALSSETGGAMRPAPIVGALREVFPKLKLETDTHGTKAKEILVTARETAFRALPHLTDPDPDFRTLTAILGEEGLLPGDAGEEAEAEGPIPDLKRKMSVTELEAFAQCPFMHYAKYGLRAREREENAVDRPSIGSLLHEGMEMLSADALIKEAEFVSMTDGELDERVEQIAGEVIPRYFAGQLTESGRGRYLAERFQKTLRRAAGLLREQLTLGEFHLADVEADFGMERYPGLLIQTETGDGVRLIGRIDRLDVYEGELDRAVRVIDYKSGDRRLSAREIYDGTALQLPLYLRAAAKGLDAEPAGMFYFSLQDPQFDREKATDEDIRLSGRMNGLTVDDPELVLAADRKAEFGDSAVIAAKPGKDGFTGTALCSKEEMAGLLDRAEKMASDFARRIREGENRPYPLQSGQRSACDYCPYRAGCGMDPNDPGRKVRRGTRLSNSEVMEQMKKGGQAHAAMDE